MVVLPAGDDPDSFLRSQGIEAFRAYIKQEKKDGLEWFVTDAISTRGDDPFTINDIMADVVNLVRHYTGHIADNYCESLAKLLGVKKSTFQMAYSEAREQLMIQQTGGGGTEMTLTEEQKASLKNYQIYEHGRRLRCNNITRGTHYDVSNFIVEPLFHLYSTESPKRIFKIKNIKGDEALVVTETPNLGKLERFKDLVERFGNYLFTGDNEAYNYLKAKIYDLMGSCLEINTLGYHLDGFYTFGNGIFTPEKKFLPANKHGIILYKDKQYFLPANSDLYRDEQNTFKEEKNFKYVKSTVSFEEWSSLFCEVHGNYGKIALAYFFAALFRSSILKTAKVPLLNLFGMPSTGKSLLAENLVALFCLSTNGMNLNSCTRASLANKLITVRDGLLIFEEYNNGLPSFVIEALKDTFDGLGRELGQKSVSRNKRTEVLSTAVVIGQELPTIDPALFTRCITLAFTKTSYTTKQTERAEELMRLRGQLSGIMAQVSTHRAQVAEAFPPFYAKYVKELQTHCEQLRKDLGEREKIRTRMIQNNAVLLAVVDVLSEVLTLPFTADELFHICADNLMDQHRQISTESEVASFWQIFEFLATNSDIGRQDFKVDGTHLYINFGRLYQLYAEVFKKQRSNKNPLNKTSLVHYLKNHSAFVEYKNGCRFHNKNTSAYVFDFEALGISIPDHSLTFAAVKNLPVKPNNETPPVDTDTQAAFNFSKKERKK